MNKVITVSIGSAAITYEVVSWFWWSSTRRRPSSEKANAYPSFHKARDRGVSDLWARRQQQRDRHVRSLESLL